MKPSAPGPSDAVHEPRRCADAIEISGDYQHRALTEGNPIQRFWHYSKMLAVERLLPPCAGDRVLDVGCGSGVISSFLAGFGARVVGIDANPDAIRFATERYAHPGVSFRQGFADHPLGEDASVDKIYCLELIEHIHGFQAEVMLQNFHRLLKPAGRIFLTTPNYHSLWPVVEWLVDRSGWAPPMARHQHVERYHRRKLRHLCHACSLSLEHLAAMSFLAPWIAPLSWRAARKLAEMELATGLTPGSVLVCVVSKKG